MFIFVFEVKVQVKHRLFLHMWCDSMNISCSNLLRTCFLSGEGFLATFFIICSNVLPTSSNGVSGTSKL